MDYVLFCVLILLPNMTFANSMPIWIKDGQVGGMSFAVSEQQIADANVKAEAFVLERTPDGSPRDIKPDANLKLSNQNRPPSPGIDLTEVAREYAIIMFFVALILAALTILVMLTVFYIRGRKGKRKAR